MYSSFSIDFVTVLEAILTIRRPLWVREMCCSRKRHVETPKERGVNGASQKEPTLRVTIFTLPDLPHLKIKDGGYSNVTDKKAAFPHPKYACTAG